MLLCLMSVQGLSGDQDIAFGGFRANTFIACGKVGAVLSAIGMHRYWTPPPPADEAALAQLSAAERHRQQTAPFRYDEYCAQA